MNNAQKLQRIAREAIGNPLATVTKHTQAPQHLADPETGDLRSGYVLDDQSGFLKTIRTSFPTTTAYRSDR